MKKGITLMVLVAMAAVFSCKKEGTSPDVRDLLTSRTWKSSGEIKNGTPQTTWCWKNYQYNFTPDGKVFVEIYANGGGCLTPPTGTILKYPWTLSGDAKWLVIYEEDPADEIDSFEIVSISESVLQTKRVVGKASPPTTTWEDTFTAVP